MMTSTPPARERITIAILALGGEGGGVLADWIRQVANEHGYVVQGTSIAGVAQRTGSTVYYIEMVKRAAEGANRTQPILAMMPAPGDVDIVIASELMEAGRAILRGFVTADRTTLIGSTHRVYAISEKAALGDGTAAGQRILDAAERRAARFIGFDMAEAAAEAGSVISSVMFGALAGSEALPFPREAFEAAIRHGGKALETNLRGFGLGFQRVRDGDAERLPPRDQTEPSTEAGRALKASIDASLPQSARPLAIEGVKRLMDYQGRSYAELYLSRLARLHAADDGAADWQLTRNAARHIALWMSYEDTIRVADLKVRAARSARVAREVRLAPGQVMVVTEYMHPRLQEICDILPVRLGRLLRDSAAVRRLAEPLFRSGRLVETTSLRWFLALRFIAGLRSIRPWTLRYHEEQQRIDGWLALAARFAESDPRAAAELIACQQLIKGYSDTYERGLARFEAILSEARHLVGQPNAAVRLRTLREAALADEQGETLACAISTNAATSGSAR